MSLASPRLPGGEPSGLCRSAYDKRKAWH